MTETQSLIADELVRTGTLTESERHEILADKCRRHILAILADERTSITLEELAEEVAKRERDCESVDSPTVESVAIRLHHVHLPKLADYDVVSYDLHSCRVDAVAVSTVLR